MKNILVLMHDDPGQEARFQGAVDITRALDGHLTCVDVSIVPVFVGEYAAVGGTAMLMEDERTREDSNRTRMEARLKVEDVPYDWSDTSGFLTPCVRDASALADLVVLNRALDKIQYPDMRELVGDVLLRSHKPIVAMPESARKFDAYGDALIAWDGSPAAEAAMRAAVPLLILARKVTILEVDDGSIAISSNQAAEYLSRHGIKPIVRRENAQLDTASTVILEIADETKAAYVVMGGFGHSRFVEAAFGGFSRRMLNECPVPLFLAH